MFNYMNGINYDNYTQFVHDVDICRSDMLDADLKLLQDKGLIIDIEKEFELFEGKAVIEYKKIRFDCFFRQKPGKMLYVFLNAAFPHAGFAHKTHFSRWSYYKFLNGSVLNIADPMCQIYEGLRLGWYYGNQDFDLRIYVSEIVKLIAEKLEISNDHIIFYGSSGGGAAVIECASHIEHAKAVSINPQIALFKHLYAHDFEKITHNDLMTEDSKWHRNNGTYYLQHNNKSKHIIMVNLRSESDMMHLDYIIKAMGLKLKYGLNFFGDLIIWLYDCDCDPYIGAHMLQDNYCLAFAIQMLIENLDSQEFMDHKDDSFYRYINEWWYAWWKREQSWRRKQPDLNYLVKCAKTLKKKALFGTGDEAQKLCEELLDINGENYYSVEAVFDNDRNKAGSVFNGIKIMHPDDISNWSDYFIIISTVKFVNQIQQQLINYGLIYGENFIVCTDLYR